MRSTTPKCDREKCTTLHSHSSFEASRCYTTPFTVSEVGNDGVASKADGEPTLCVAGGRATAPVGALTTLAQEKGIVALMALAGRVHTGA